MKRILIVKIKGGLGNQLFCYATARRLALHNNAELVLDIISGFKFDSIYKRIYSLNSFQIPARYATPEERFEPFGRIRRLVHRKLSEIRQFANRRYIRQTGVIFDPKILSLQLKEGLTYFEPFGQSEDYFFDIKDILKQELVLKTMNNKKNIDIAQLIDRKNSVCIHVRWFDDGVVENSSNTTLGYYTRAIKILLTKIHNPHFFIFSDKPKRAELFLMPVINKLNFTVVSHNVNELEGISDFWLIQRCSSFIIGNSTFAWWAAWLGEQEGKKSYVFAPKENLNPSYSVTAWGFPKLLPERWFLL